MTGRRPPRGSRGAAYGLSLLVGLSGLPGRAISAPVPAVSEPSLEPSPSDEPTEALPPLPDDPLAGPRALDPEALVEGEAAAYRLYMEGKRRLEEGEPEHAEQTFAAALRTLPDQAPYARSRGSLALWWVRCHVELYERSGELAVLDRETAILAAYVARLDAIAVSAEDRAHKQDLVQRRLDEIEGVRRLRAAAQEDLETQLNREHTGYRVSTWRPDTLQDLGWYPRRDDPRKRAVQATGDVGPGPGRDVAPEPARERRPGVGLVVAGALSMAAGAAGLGVMGVGMARGSKANDFDPMQSPMERREQIVAGVDANTISASGAIAGGVVLATGIVLTVLGAKRMKQRPATTGSARVALGPWGLRGRF